MTEVPALPRDWQQIMAAFLQLLIGLASAFVLFGAVYALYSVIPDMEQQKALTHEDGFFETMGAAGFLFAGVMQLLLYWRSEVPAGRRLVSFARRNVFYLGLAFVLLLAFAEEISWGQRILGWATPEFLLDVNMQSETNIHNLAGIQRSPLNMTRLFNLFSLGFAVVVPLTAATVLALAALYRRVSLPVVPIWVGGLFLGHFLTWRLFSQSSAAASDEIEEAILAFCWLTLGVASYLAARRSSSQSA